MHYHADEIADRSPCGVGRWEQAPPASSERAFLAVSVAQGRSSTMGATNHGPFEPHPWKLQPPCEEQHDEHDYDDADDADASMTVAIAISSKASTEPAKQEYHEYDDEYESDGHDVSP
jgi:hypothetical protein